LNSGHFSASMIAMPFSRSLIWNRFQVQSKGKEEVLLLARLLSPQLLRHVLCCFRWRSGTSTMSS